MNRFFKCLLIIFVLLPIVLFSTVWAILEFTPQAKWRAMAAQQIGQKLNRQIEIGTVHLSWTGIGFDTLKLSEIPNFKAGTFFFAKGVHLGWGLRTLWQGLDLKKKMITRSSGHFHIDDFENPHYIAHDFSVHWSLTDMDPTGSHLNGWATLEQGPGLLQNIDQLVAASPAAKIALTPVMAILNVQHMGILNLGLPDLRHWPIQGVHGNYSFKNGEMTIKQLAIDSRELNLGTTGVVNLGTGNLLLDVQLHSAPSAVSGALDAKLRISGTTSHPKVDLSSLKKQAFKATVTHLLETPGAKKEIDKALNNLFH